jgi:hypothetical protein
MKLGNKMQFGFTAVQAGQKSATVNAEPRLIANSTVGKFLITAPVSKAMGVAVGENIMFLNNIANVETAIKKRVEDVVTWAETNGINLDTREGEDAAIKEFSVWAIAKGVLQYDGKGNPVMASVRYTEDDKKKFIAEHAAELVNANREVLIERNGGEDADDETLASLITIDDIESPKYHSATGSKTSTTGSSTGVGCQLNFTDTAIWNALKADLGDAKDKKNRVYNVLLDSAFSAQVSNGKDFVEVLAYPIEFLSDEDPIVREKKD